MVPTRRRAGGEYQIQEGGRQRRAGYPGRDGRSVPTCHRVGSEWAVRKRIQGSPGCFAADGTGYHHASDREEKETVRTEQTWLSKSRRSFGAPVFYFWRRILL